MKRYLLRRLGWFALTLWIVVTASFFLMRAVPGGPLSTERTLRPEVELQIQQRYHLDWPLWRQYAHYLGPLDLSERGPFGDGTRTFGGVLAGDFGPSFQHRDLTVNDVLAESLPISFLLGLVALTWALALGVSAGAAAALRPGTRLDALVRGAATATVSIPSFLLAGLLILVFAFAIPILPVAGWNGPKYAILPGIVLGAPFAGYVARLTRAGLLDAFAQPHILVAIAKGLPERTVLLRHALRGGLLPVVSYLGPATAGILTGSLVVERIFFIPGAGTHFVTSALSRDYTLSLGLAIVFTALVFGLNTLVDLAYTLLDPRIDLEEL